MADEPDLMAELDDAEAIISGEAEKIVTEWGIRHNAQRRCPVTLCRSEEAARAAAAYRSDQLNDPCTVVSSKVTWGAWEDA